MRFQTPSHCTADHSSCEVTVKLPINGMGLEATSVSGHLVSGLKQDVDIIEVA